MKFPVLWLPFVSELAKVIYLAWDLGSRSYITLHFSAKVVEKEKKCILEHLLANHDGER